MPDGLKSEFDWYLKHQDELVQEYEGRVLVIKDCKVLGAYDTDLEAISETRKTHALGTFLVQRCESGENSYTQVFHSRVAYG